MTTPKIVDYKITMIQVKNLSVVWVKSQRPFNSNWAKQIADNFDPDRFEPIIVTLPNGAGFYHIIEGQHRKAALEQFAAKMNRSDYGGDEWAPCRVIDHADPAKAADIWLGINEGRKAARPVPAFLVAVEAKRDLECAINRIVKQAGYVVAEGNATGAANRISAVSALRKIYRNYGDKTLQHTLQATRLLWNDDPHGVSASILAGLGLFLHEFHSHVEPKRLYATITGKHKSPYKFIDAAIAHKEKLSEPLNYAMAELIRLTYNKGLPENKRLKRKET